MAGIKVNTQKMVCGECHHGRKGEFFPLTATGSCPKCSNAHEHIPLKQYLSDLVGKHFWYVCALDNSSPHEELDVIPVMVKSITAGKLILLYEYEPGETCPIMTIDPTLLFESKNDACKKAMNHANEIDIVVIPAVG